jgi:hypothetical protein
MSMLDGRGFVPADFDRDGDIDFFLTNNNQVCVYLENRCGEARNWLTVQLEGTRDNAFGIGAKVYATSVRDGRTITQVREIHIGSGYLSSPPAEAHFGLDDADVVDRLEVVWPNGERQSFDQVSAGQLVVVRQGGDLRTRKPGVVEPAHRPDATRTGPATETPERPE